MHEIARILRSVYNVIVSQEYSPNVWLGILHIQQSLDSSLNPSSCLIESQEYASPSSSDIQLPSSIRRSYGSY
jgi:hypothetical protein